MSSSEEKRILELMDNLESDKYPLKAYDKIGKRGVRRLDGREKASGKALYTVDVQLPGMLHMRFFTSPFPHARIRSMDTTGRRPFPGSGPCCAMMIRNCRKPRIWEGMPRRPFPFSRTWPISREKKWERRWRRRRKPLQRRPFDESGWNGTNAPLFWIRKKPSGLRPHSPIPTRIRTGITIIRGCWISTNWGMWKRVLPKPTR